MPARSCCGAPTPSTGGSRPPRRRGRPRRRRRSSRPASRRARSRRSRGRRGAGSGGCPGSRQPRPASARRRHRPFPAVRGCGPPDRARGRARVCRLLGMTDDDPYLARLRTICLALPGAVEGSSHGRPVFRTTKAFVSYRYGPKGGEHRPDHTLVVLPDPEDEAALRADERFFVPAYLGSAGWLGTDLSDGGATAPDAVDWAEVAELVEASYRRTAPARLVRELDAGEAPA